MNLPGAIIDLKTVTEKDEDDIVNFGLTHGIDMIALSFTRTGNYYYYFYHTTLSHSKLKFIFSLGHP